MILPNKLTIPVPMEWAGRTVESFLRQQLHFSRSRIRELKKNQAISCNGAVIWATSRLAGGESLEIALNNPFQNMVPEALPLSIVYEDSDLIVVNKPAGMIVHPVGVYQNGTLANGLIAHWRNRGEAASFHPVHRLDRLTSGLIVVAKNPWAHQQLDLQINSGALHRLYLAVCDGVPSPASGRIDAPLKPSGTGFRWMVAADGKAASTRFRVIQHFADDSLIVLKLYTGRTHQIRVHLCHLGHPLRGDFYYANPDSRINRPALHSARLRFIHPRTGRRLQLTAPIPEDFQPLLELEKNN